MKTQILKLGISGIIRKYLEDKDKMDKDQHNKYDHDKDGHE